MVGIGKSGKRFRHLALDSAPSTRASANGQNFSIFFFSTSSRREQRSAGYGIISW